MVDRRWWIVSSHLGLALIPSWYAPYKLGMMHRKKYVKAVLDSLPAENVHVNTPIKSVTPHENGVTLVEESGRTHEYDYVIMA
jgi:protoporphyrinogen oxidase